jgi:pectin methylesterase-like acyl-CoA thioesterase
VTPPADSIVVPDDYSSIQEAVDNAPWGGTVFVRSGSYSDRVFVNKSLSLIGEDPENTVISISSLPFLSYAAIEVSASDVTISGFTITHAYIGIDLTDDQDVTSAFSMQNNRQQHHR